MKTDKRITSLEILKRARALIKKHGWVKGTMGHKGVGFCVSGAVHEAVHDSGTDRPFVFINSTLRAFARANSIHNGYSGFIIAWNDADRRKKSEVLRAFDKAIAYVERRREYDRRRRAGG